MKIIIPIMHYYPSNAIGANRWNNLSKLLARDFKVEIWTVRREINIENIDKNITIRSFKSDPMYFLDELAINNYFLKIFKILIIRFLSIFFWPTDMGEYFSLFLKKEVSKEIKNNSLFIITGGSFALQSKLFKYISEKNYNKIILDFRDVWNSDPHRFYLLDFIKKRAENIERTMLLSERAKKIFVTKSLVKNMVSKVNNYEIILNGHDFKLSKFNDFKENFLRKKNLKKIKIIYLGTIGKGRDTLFLEFIKKLSPLDKDIEIDIFGKISIKLRRFILNFNSEYITVRYLNKINRDKIKSISERYNLGLQITSNSYPYALSTKLYEYPALGLPQICICNKGEIIDMILKNKIGTIIKSTDSKYQVSKRIYDVINKIECENLFKFAQEATWDKRYKELLKIINTYSQ